VTVTHAADDAAVHVQPPSAVTETDPVAAAAPTDAPAGASV
jgi:hypothetical protein